MADLALLRQNGWVEVTQDIAQMIDHGFFTYNELWAWAGTRNPRRLNDILSNEGLGDLETLGLDEILSVLRQGPITDLFMAEFPDDLAGTRSRIWFKRTPGALDWTPPP